MGFHYPTPNRKEIGAKKTSTWFQRRKTGASERKYAIATTGACLGRSIRHLTVTMQNTFNVYV